MALKALPRKRPKSAADLREPALERPELTHDLDRTIQATLEDGGKAALALVSVDHLDIVNVAFGHGVGSKVLAAARDAGAPVDHRAEYEENWSAVLDGLAKVFA